MIKTRTKYIERSIYFSLWSKYRPAILQLMKAPGNEERQYKLSAHEFKALGDKMKSGYTFVLETSNGEAVNNIAGSEIAKDLLVMLQQSKTGMQLLNEVPFELRLDKQFVFHVTRKAEAIPITSSAITEAS